VTALNVCALRERSLPDSGLFVGRSAGGPRQAGRPGETGATPVLATKVAESGDFLRCGVKCCRFSGLLPGVGLANEGDHVRVTH
jgi:hypothetical protein